MIHSEIIKRVLSLEDSVHAECLSSSLQLFTGVTQSGSMFFTGIRLLSLAFIVSCKQSTQP